MKRTPIARKTPVKRVNKARKAKNFKRSYGSADRAEWCKGLPCSVLGCQNAPCDNAHVAEKGETGASYKADAKWTIPLCSLTHHKEYHQIGRESFTLKYKLDLSYHAYLTEMAWTMINGDAR